MGTYYFLKVDSSLALGDVKSRVGGTAPKGFKRLRSPVGAEEYITRWDANLERFLRNSSLEKSTDEIDRSHTNSSMRIFLWGSLIF